MGQGKLPDIILTAADRLKNAQIENTDAIKLIEEYNASDGLIYQTRHIRKRYATIVCIAMKLWILPNMSDC